MKLDYEKDSFVVPAKMVPSWCAFHASTRGAENNFLISAWGGLGDIICAEPAIRFALKKAPEVSFSLQCATPEIFSHLKFKEILGPELKHQDPERFHIFQTIKPPTDILWHFMSHMLVNAVDFSSICLFRMTIPISEKEIQLPDFEMTDQVRNALDNPNTVVVHPGKHWPSKTFPLSYWEKQIKEFKNQGFEVVLIGKTIDENTGYVPVSGEGCIDLRDKLSLSEFICLLKNAKFVFSNDSSPIHAAASGDAFIGFIATPKRPDYIMHWRKGTFGYRMHNFGKDGPWNYDHYLPTQKHQLEIESLPEGLMEKILPNPANVAEHFRWIGLGLNPVPVILRSRG